MIGKESVTPVDPSSSIVSPWSSYISGEKVCHVNMEHHLCFYFTPFDWFSTRPPTIQLVPHVCIHTIYYICLKNVSIHSDEDINTLATIIHSIEILGPITQSRAQQLNY
jgi:hypothetical protein